MPRYVILAPGSFHYIYSKTGNMLIRYKSDEVIGVIDPTQSGKTAHQVLGWGGDIPVFPSFNHLKDLNPTHLVIGSAPQGGQLSSKYRKEIISAISHNCHIISGLHSFLNDDPELTKLATQFQISLTDLRKPPQKPHFPKGTWKDREFPVLLVTGSDCDTGKMTTAWEIFLALKRRKYNVQFIGTGQTGILLSGKGIPIDAVISDFMAGEIEHCLDELSPDTDLAIIEGQGALNNELYSGVTLGLLHGSMPDYLVMTHEPGRKLDVANHPIPKLDDLMKIHIDLLKPFKSSQFVGINYLTLKYHDELALDICNSAKNQFQLPVSDIVRFGGHDLIKSIETLILSWK